MSKQKSNSAAGAQQAPAGKAVELPHPLSTLCPASERRRILRYVQRSLRRHASEWHIGDDYAEHRVRRIVLERGLLGGVWRISIHEKSMRVPQAFAWRLRLARAVEAARIRQAHQALFGY